MSSPDEEWAAQLEEELELNPSLFKAKLRKFHCYLPRELWMTIFTFARPGGRVCKAWTSATDALSRKTVTSTLVRILQPLDGEIYRSTCVTRIANAIETELYQLSRGRVSRIYHRKARQIVFNLKGNRNNGLRQRVLSCELNPETLVRLDANGMANPQLIAKRKEWLQKRKHEVMREAPEVAGFTATDMFTCPSCGGKHTRYRQWRRKAIVDRTRIIVVCQNCPNRWEL